MLEFCMNREVYDDDKERFLNVEYTFKLEHSLSSLSKWESKWRVPFLETTEKTPEQIRDYIQCMSAEKIPEHVLDLVDTETAKVIGDYIENPMTATWFTKEATKGRQTPEAITAELIYYWMVSYGIPFECQYWHLNRLITLIRVCSKKQERPKKVPRSTLNQRNRSLNAARRQRLGTSG